MDFKEDYDSVRREVLCNTDIEFRLHQLPMDHVLRIKDTNHSMKDRLTQKHFIISVVFITFKGDTMSLSVFNCAPSQHGLPRTYIFNEIISYNLKMALEGKWQMFLAYFPCFEKIKVGF
jgi:hypothetical protein